MTRRTCGRSLKRTVERCPRRAGRGQATIACIGAIQRILGSAYHPHPDAPSSPGWADPPSSGPEPGNQDRSGSVVTRRDGSPAVDRSDDVGEPRTVTGIPDSGVVNGDAIGPQLFAGPPLLASAMARSPGLWHMVAGNASCAYGSWVFLWQALCWATHNTRSGWALVGCGP